MQAFDDLGEYARPLIDLSGELQALVRTKLWARIAFAMGAGIVLGLALSPTGLGRRSSSVCARTSPGL